MVGPHCRGLLMNHPDVIGAMELAIDSVLAKHPAPFTGDLQDLQSEVAKAIADIRVIGDESGEFDSLMSPDGDGWPMEVFVRRGGQGPLGLCFDVRPVVPNPFESN